MTLTEIQAQLDNMQCDHNDIGHYAYILLERLQNVEKLVDRSEAEWQRILPRTCTSRDHTKLTCPHCHIRTTNPLLRSILNELKSTISV